MRAKKHFKHGKLTTATNDRVLTFYIIDIFISLEIISINNNVEKKCCKSVNDEISGKR